MTHVFDIDLGGDKIVINSTWDKPIEVDPYKMKFINKYFYKKFKKCLIKGDTVYILHNRYEIEDILCILFKIFNFYKLDVSLQLSVSLDRSICRIYTNLVDTNNKTLNFCIDPIYLSRSVALLHSNRFKITHQSKLLNEIYSKKEFEKANISDDIIKILMKYI